MSNTFSTLREIRERAKSLITPLAWDWLEGGVEYENTIRRNEEVFRRIALRPRVLRDVETIDTTCSFLGNKLAMPLIIAPTGHLTQFHFDGEAELAAGVDGFDTVFCVSTQTRIAMPEIRQRAPNMNWMFQVYFYGDREWILEQVRLAESLGASSICVCVDAPWRPARYRDRENRYDARKYGRRTTPPVPAQHLSKKVTWDDIAWLRSETKLPLLLKGILTAEDGKIAVEHGADAVWLSNHGGRQLECDLTGVEVVAEVREAVGSVPLVVDGGVRTGSDVLKCLGMGADMVAIGRPAIYGLVADGAAGVRRTLELFQEELSANMAMCGLTAVNQITRDVVRTKSW